jgi:Zn-dependent protease
MGNDIPLGRIAGIRVGMSVTVFLVAGFYTFALASYRFPITQPELAGAWYWVAGITAAILLLLSLLVHEIGHALVAKDEGIGVTSMGLTLWGGVTRMESSPTTAGSEFRVAVVGPIATAACGVVFLVAAYLMPDGGVPGLAGDVLRWVGELNLILAVLNMVPAAPLDGGRVLSAAIWRATRSQTVALTWSSGIGVVLGMALVTYGFRDLRNGDSNQFGFFLLLIGAFIGLTAFQQLRTAPLYRALDGLTVADAMSANPPAAPAWSSVGEFLRTTPLRPDQQAYPMVGPDGQVLGLLSAAAIRAVNPASLDATPVPALAYPLDRVTFVHATELLLPALQKVEGGDVRVGMVIAEDGRVVGTIDPAIVDHLVAQRRAEARSDRVGAH